MDTARTANLNSILTFRLVCLFVIISAARSAGSLAVNPRYHLQKRLAVPDSDAIIELVADTRVSSSTDYEAIPENALHAKVQVMLPNGKKLSSLLLETPRADIEWLEETPKGTHLLFVTEDKTIDFGSYNGPISVLYSLNGGELLPVMAENFDTKKKSRMGFMRALKENWRVEKSGLNRYPELYLVSCRPVLNSEGGNNVVFRTSYSRYFFDENRWHAKTRTVKGLWEDEGSFPPKRLFP